MATVHNKALGLRLGPSLRRPTLPPVRPFHLKPQKPRVGHFIDLGAPVGRVFVEAQIGAGEAAQVFAVRLQNVTGTLALKWFNLRTTSQTAMAKEVSLQKQLAGIGAPRIYASKAFQTCGFILMAIVGTRSLEAWQSQAEHKRAAMAAKGKLAPLPPLGANNVLTTVRALLAALAHCHASGVVHRDLKLDNIMVSTDGIGAPNAVALIDFGLASPVCKDASAVGTITYMSPEALRGASATYAADVWAFGVCVYRLLVGIEPYYADTEHEVRHRLLTNRPTFGMAELKMLLAHSALKASAQALLFLLCQQSLQPNAKYRPSAAEMIAWPAWRSVSH